jgi:hypothetical protein
MIATFLNRIADELQLSHAAKTKEKQTYLFEFANSVAVTVKDLDPGVSLKAPIITCPKHKKEELFIQLMKANLLGQGTGNGRIGMDLDEKTLTLSLGIPYELSYQAFRETIEDFINYLIYWREEIRKFDNEQT